MSAAVAAVDRAEAEAPVWHQDNYGQVLHLGVQLEKASGLGKQAVLKPSLVLHLHFEQHQWLLRCARFSGLRPERPIKAMVGRFSLGSFNAVQRISSGIGPERRS